ncbi:MAG TPA: alpha-L-fucosidase [Planctomycetota bacterium]|jgi:alpha-L-fucosidase
MAEQALSYEERLKWFHDARFGIFIHWGLYSLLGRGEWVMFNERIRPKDYAKLARRFNPKKFDADAWAALAVEAGAKYMVLTTRHHDGFCLFDSKVSDFTAPKTAAKRDFVAEYANALRKAGLKVGFYYSLLDWRFPGYFEAGVKKESAEAMVQQYHAQVRELLTNYGKVDILWYDGDWIDHGRAGISDKATFWRSAEVNAMARNLQPHIIINNRSGINEDLDTPEQHVTASAPGRGWESCMTIGDSCGWGYVHNNPNWKTVPQLLQNLVTAAAGEGNYLLNMGPRPDGQIRKEEVVRLKAMGGWLKVNGEAIYDSQRCALHGGMIGAWTRKGNAGYLHIYRWPGREATVPLVKTKAVSATLLGSDAQLSIKQDYNGRLTVSGLPLKPPHPAANVIKVQFEDAPASMEEKDHAAWLEGKAE